LYYKNGEDLQVALNVPLRLWFTLNLCTYEYISDLSLYLSDPSHARRILKERVQLTEFFRRDVTFPDPKLERDE
jgi:hypothetical protein